MMHRVVALFGLTVAALAASIALLGEGVVGRQQQFALLQQQYQQQQEASRHADRLRKHRDTLSAKIAALDAEQDELLDRFGAT